MATREAMLVFQEAGAVWLNSRFLSSQRESIFRALLCARHWRRYEKLDECRVTVTRTLLACCQPVPPPLRGLIELPFGYMAKLIIVTGNPITHIDTAYNELNSVDGGR